MNNVTITITTIPHLPLLSPPITPAPVAVTAADVKTVVAVTEEVAAGSEVDDKAVDTAEEEVRTLMEVAEVLQANRRRLVPVVSRRGRLVPVPVASRRGRLLPDGVLDGTRFNILSR